MATPHQIALPYRRNPCDWFARIRHLPHPVLLDSCRDLADKGRYDLIAAAPIKTLSQRTNASEDYSQTLQNLLNELSAVENSLNLPFYGGLIGWLDYELSYPQHQLATTKTTEHKLPNLHMGLYEWAIINDHDQQQSLLVAHPQCHADTLAAIKSLLLDEQTTQDIASTFELTSDWQSNLDRSRYGRAFERIQQYIRAGDCYQINLAQRFHSQFTGDPWQAYQQLRSVAAAPFSAFIPTDNGAILSLSPETFLRFDTDGNVETQPIKGTAPRLNDPKADQSMADALTQSAKNRAENLMIVDLLRNDLGQCCQAGSVTVNELFTLHSFATVHHLISRISGKLREDIHPLTMLKAAFPGGSITGAPKKRAMEIIAELEPNKRSIYCGAIGYLSRDGRGEFNIAIRTLLAENETIYCWAGGGIVSDSKENEEYEESLSKVDKLLHALSRSDFPVAK
jgi:para-aminobenzoate synthetase component 1